MSREVEVGQLWSLKEREVVVCLTHDASASQPETFIAVVVIGDGGDPSWHQGQELIVHTSGLSQEWTVKPLTGVAR